MTHPYHIVRDMPLEMAHEHADYVTKTLEPWCYPGAVSVCGDYRRNQKNLFGLVVVAAPLQQQDALRSIRDWVNHRWGPPKNRTEFPSDKTEIRLSSQPYKIDFYWVRVGRFAMAQFRLTGPMQFVNRAFDYWRKNTGGDVRDDELIDERGNTVLVPSEDKFFDLLKCPRVAPEHRREK